MWGTFTSFNECNSLFLTALYECVCHFFSHALNLSFSLTHYLRLFLSFYLVTHTLTVYSNYLTLVFHWLSFIDSLFHPFTHSLIPNSQQCCGCPAGGAVSWWVSSVEVHWLWWKHRSEESGWKQHPPEWGQTDESYTHLFTCCLTELKFFVFDSFIPLIYLFCFSFFSFLFCL